MKILLLMKRVLIFFKKIILGFIRFLVKVPDDDETRYKPYLIRIPIYIIILFTITLFIQLDIFKAGIAIGSICLVILVLLFFCCIYAFYVWCNNHPDKDKDNYPSIPIAKKDVLFWIKRANEPDKIIIKDDSKKYAIDIRFSVEKKLIYGFKFYDKGIYIDNKEYLENDAIDFLKNNLKGHIYIIWYTESNDPKQFKIVLNELKNKEKTDEE